MSSVSADAIRELEERLLKEADMLGIILRGLKSADPARASHVVGMITDRLQQAVRGAGEPTADERPRPVLVSRSESTEAIEDFILENLEQSPRGLTVQEFVDRFDEAQLAIRRQTLVVRLHRMVQSGRLSSIAHGHYALSEAERARRSS
jgi:hypothetical protein